MGAAWQRNFWRVHPLKTHWYSLSDRQVGIYSSRCFSFAFAFTIEPGDPPNTPWCRMLSLVLPWHGQTTLVFWLRLMTQCATLRHGFVTWNVSKVPGLHLISRQSWERPISIDSESLNALLKTYDKKSALATSSWILTSLKSQHGIQAVSDKYKVIKVLVLLKKNIWSFQHAHNGFIIAAFPLLVSRDLSESGAEILHHFSYKKKLISNRWCIHYIPEAIVLGIQGSSRKIRSNMYCCVYIALTTFTIERVHLLFSISFLSREVFFFHSHVPVTALDIEDAERLHWGSIELTKKLDNHWINTGLCPAHGTISVLGGFMEKGRGLS